MKQRMKSEIWKIRKVRTANQSRKKNLKNKESIRSQLQAYQHLHHGVQEDKSKKLKTYLKK